MLNEAGVETAARKYCELIGVDPDELVSHGADPDGRGNVPAILLRSPRWKLVARQVKAADAMQEAIKFGYEEAV